MTIKQFARLCGCNAQTLRYYDRIGLMKPAQVDQWSGYRYYDEVQALDFVKIKNLQLADFSIEEIKFLLTQPEDVLCAAFDRKIEEQRKKLERIVQIQESYLRERQTMEKLIHGVTGLLLEQIGDYDGPQEFGLHPEEGPFVVARLREFMERMLAESLHWEPEVNLLVNDEVVRGADRALERVGSLDIERDTVLLRGRNMAGADEPAAEALETVWEAHGWRHARDFIDGIPPMDDGAEYRMEVRLDEEKRKDALPFALYMFGVVLTKRGDECGVRGCAVEESEDGRNHFRLLRVKPAADSGQ